MGKHSKDSQPPTLIVTLMDHSGSMESIRSDIEGGYAAYIREQKEQQGECSASLYQFDGPYHQGQNWFEPVYENVSLSGPVPEYRLIPRGQTPLRDAIGRMLLATDETVKGMPAGSKVFVAICTDGKENHSREFDWPTIRKMIKEREERGWLFTYLGANQDAFAEGAKMGLNRNATIDYMEEGVHEVFAAVSSNASSLRANPDGPCGQSVSYSPQQRAAAMGKRKAPDKTS